MEGLFGGFLEAASLLLRLTGFTGGFFLREGKEWNFLGMLAEVDESPERLVFTLNVGILSPFSAMLLWRLACAKTIAASRWIFSAERSAGN